MKKRRILCDVDGVWADFLVPALDIVHSISGRRYGLEEFHDWDIFETIPREHEPAFYEAWKMPGMCLSIPVIPGSHEGVKGLQERGELYIVTSPMHIAPTWEEERRNWLLHHFGIPRRRVVQVSDKFVVSGDWLIEDKPKNLELWLAEYPNGRGILWTQPYNKSADLGPRAHRAHTWEEVFQILDDEEASYPFHSEQDTDPVVAVAQSVFDHFHDEAVRQGIPGPSVNPHPEGYQGPCLCYECITADGPTNQMRAK